MIHLGVTSMKSFLKDLGTFRHFLNFCSSLTFEIRYVDGTPTSEVTPDTIRYIHPPHHGYPKIRVLVMNDRLTSLSFHINQPSHSWNTAFSNFALETATSAVKGQSHKVDPESTRSSSTWFAFFSFHIDQITIPGIQLFRNLTLKNPRWRSWLRSKIT